MIEMLLRKNASSPKHSGYFYLTGLMRRSINNEATSDEADNHGALRQIKPPTSKVPLEVTIGGLLLNLFRIVAAVLPSSA